MAEGRKKSIYNERFSFADPLDRISGSRSTRYRAMKRKAELNPSPEMSAASQDDETEVNDDRQCNITCVTVMKSCQKDDHQEEPLSTYADDNYSGMCETGLQSDELFDGEVDSHFLDAPGMDESEDETKDEYSDDHSECDQTSPAISSSALLYEGADLTTCWCKQCPFFEIQDEAQPYSRGFRVSVRASEVTLSFSQQVLPIAILVQEPIL